MPNKSPVRISVVQGDIVEHVCDVAVFKHAQALYGADGAAYRSLIDAGIRVELPRTGSSTTVDPGNVIAAGAVVFVGVEPLSEFGYPEIRHFARRALAAIPPGASTVALTLHGPGYGLDEVESFHSEVAGLIDACESGEAAAGITDITIVEFQKGRAERLRKLLAAILPDGLVRRAGATRTHGAETRPQEILRTAGYNTAEKIHVFVAMPFSKDMLDVFEFGIKGPVESYGYLCERGDMEVFVGDIGQWIKKQIASADMVIADLSGANPNVYLEVGYAWGTGRPTLLIARDGTKTLFDVQSHRTIFYESIKHLSDELRRHLQGLEKVR